MAKNVRKSSLLDGIGDEPPVLKNEHTVTPTPAYTYTPAHVPTRGNKERKTERLQLIVRPSTKAKLAKYAEDHNTSSNEVVQSLLDNLLKDY